MDELQRQRYLSALGIETFVPRLVLPWAKPSVPCELPQVTQAPAPQALVSAPKQAAASQAPAPQKASGTAGAEAVGQVLRDMGVSKSEPVRKEPLKAALPKRREALETIHLHLWRPAEDLIVLDHYQPGTALPSDKLLHNILKLLWRPDVQVNAGEAVRCPISDKVANLYTREDMQLELQAWFSEELQKTPEAHVWLFGAEAAKFLLQPDAAKETPDAYHFKRLPLATADKASGTREALVLPSLTEMLNTPELKTKLWTTVHDNG
ncbi:hypothetical protein [uncultured Gilvimarinus sp.]|uniref:hypothetical protein n=1 Tax=uncultured Gilvimarinus sp. TaxID=1689143 RepID=UPI0030EEFDBE|tara:strand:+ start:799 stop:1593 length:795 start_codon:yes stop_codon:yes gene_type:complete